MAFFPLDKLAFGDSANLDAFGRLRVSRATTRFDSQLQYDGNPLLWNTVLAASGTSTHLPNESSVRMRVTASGDSVVRQTKRYFRYLPGKSQNIKCTFLPGNPATGVTKRVGYFDANDGIFWQQDATTNYIVRRTSTSGSPVNNAVAQASWNLDTMDGSGPSGITLDFSKTQILAIDFQWLGVGRVRIGWVINGSIFYCHEFLNSNVLTTVYMKTANLPVRYEITGAAGAATTDLIQICTSVESEGGADTETGIPFAATNGITTRSVTTRQSVLAIRPKATFNSIINRGQISLIGVEVYVSAAAFWEVVYNPTLSGASWSSVDANSIVERDSSATTVTGGTRVLAGYGTTTGGGGARGNTGRPLTARLPFALDVSGSNPIILCVAATSFSGSSSISASLIWEEIR